MDTVWHTAQANEVQTALALVFLLLGLYGLRRRNWSRQKQKFISELHMAPAEVEAVFRPTRDAIYNGIRRAGCVVVALGGGFALYLVFVVGGTEAGLNAFRVLAACAAVLLITGGAIYAFKSQAMREIARLYKIDNFRPGAVGGVNSTAKRPLLHGYTRYHGIVLLIMGLGVGYGVLRQFVPVLPDLKWPG